MTAETFRPRLPDKTALLERVRPGRAAWEHSARPARIETAGTGEESVWDYPRPPRLRDTPQRVRVMVGDTVIADTQRAKNIIETASAPAHYIPPDDIATGLLRATDYITVCEWKGAAVHYDLMLPNRIIEHDAFAYPDPFDDLDESYAEIAGWYVFYPAKVDCFIGNERVRPQPGGYYAGWVTDAIRGPIKGAPGSGNW